MKESETQELYSISVAAAYLSKHLTDKSPEQWRLALQNNRSPSRAVAFRIPYEKLGGGVFYGRNELARFVEFEKMRQLGTIKLSGRAVEALKAYGVGEAGGSLTGRKLNVTGINPQVDEATGKMFIQVIVDSPLMVYRLELDEAKSISQELISAIKCCERNRA